MGAYNGLDYWDMVRIGDDPFNMTVAGLRMAHIANGVANSCGHIELDVAGCQGFSAHNRNNKRSACRHLAAPSNMPRQSKQAAMWAAHTEAKRQLLDFIRQRTGVSFKEDCLVIGLHGGLQLTSEAI